MRKLTTSLLSASVLLTGVLIAPPLHADSSDGGMMKDGQCDMMRGRQSGMMGGGGMMGRGGMMQGDRGGMSDRDGMMQGDRDGMRSMMKQMNQMMKQMSQMMDQYSDMMSDKKNAPSEPEKK